ncbi:hypothetical protein ABIF34_006403 [Bradyrhizobium japonicum]
MIWYLIPPSPNSGDIGMVNGSAQPILRCISPKRRAMMNLHQSPTRMETSCDVRSLPIHLRWSRAQTNRHLRLTIEPWTERSPSQFGSSREVHCTGGGLRELVPIIAQKKTPASSRSFRLPPRAGGADCLWQAPASLCPRHQNGSGSFRVAWVRRVSLAVFFVGVSRSVGPTHRATRPSTRARRHWMRRSKNGADVRTTTLPSFNSRQSGYGCALMNPRPNTTLADC